MIFDVEDYLSHYGTPRHSGRYPWGSGGDDANAGQRSKHFLDYVDGLKKQGLTESEVATGMGMSTGELRAQKSIAKAEVKAGNIAMITRLKEKGMSNVAISKQMGIPEPTIRSLMAPGQKDKQDAITTTANMLQKNVDEKGYIDIGTGVENYLGVSKERLNSSLYMLKDRGYVVQTVQIPQIMGRNQKTYLKVLAPPGTTYADIAKNMSKVQLIQEKSDDGGRTYEGMLPPMIFDSKRLGINYGDEGGRHADGVIYIRPGVEDISLGKARYAQVRIAVDGTHYIKGMAMYKDDLPEGVDLVFNTNKNKKPGGSKLDVLKPNEPGDPDNPFSSSIRDQLTRRDADGKRHVTSVMNKVNEEGDWEEWNRNLSSQMLSKQSPKLAQSQLGMTYERRKMEYETIMAMNNPAVRKKLLDAFAQSTDSAAVHLKAAALPRQRTQVILPMNTLKENEVYAPNFNNGETVALVRYPHGGTFEIPELIVNNKNPQGRKLLGQATDAIGIHSKVAEHLSGADFDGDTVVVIPNGHRLIKTTPALEKLRNFDPKAAYPRYEGMPKMAPSTKQTQMGIVSNLITDMTIRGASAEELTRAVRHSMVVIDAEKHDLNYRQSAIDNGISQLKEKYQGGARQGANTLISQAGSKQKIPDRKLRKASAGGPVDPETGKLVYTPTGKGYTIPAHTRVTPKGRVKEVPDKYVPNTVYVKKLALTEDAHTLSSGKPIERVYADHSNRLKALANQARKDSYHTTMPTRSPSAAKAYASEVDRLNAALNNALKNAPLERKAQLLANSKEQAERQAKPNMTDAEIKKLKGRALAVARARTGAHKADIYISDKEWAAIQANAISPSKLSEILKHSDLKRIKELSTPKSALLMTTTKKNRATSMLTSGYTQAEVAAALGVSLTTLKNSIGGV